MDLHVCDVTHQTGGISILMLIERELEIVAGNGTVYIVSQGFALICRLIGFGNQFLLVVLAISRLM